MSMTDPIADMLVHQECGRGWKQTVKMPSSNITVFRHIAKVLKDEGYIAASRA